MWGWLWQRFGNERGQLNLSGALNTTNQLLNTAGQFANLSQRFRRNPTTGSSNLSLGGLNIPTSLAGAGLLGAGVLSDKEPGQVTEARQFLRNRFSSPTALSEQFSGQLGGLMTQYQPLLAQQRQRDIADISQRYAAAFPKTVGAQGPEFGALSQYITDQALPREQAQMADIGRQLLTEQGNAANTILQTNQPNPLSQLSSLLGYDLLTRGQGGAGGVAGGSGGGGVGGDGGGLSGMAGDFGGAFGSQLLSAVGAANTTGNTGPLLSLLASGALRGMPFPIGLQANTPAGQVIQQAINQGLVESPAATQGGVSASGPNGPAAGMLAKTGMDFGLPGPGLLGPAGFSSGGGLLSAGGSALAGGAVGYKVGTAIADAYEQRHVGETSNVGGALRGGTSGAASGALTGFAIGGPVGAMVGAIAGGLSGGVSGLFAERRREDANIARETQLTSSQRPAALQAAGDIYTQSDALEKFMVTNTERLTQGLQRLLDAGHPQAKALVEAIRQAKIGDFLTPSGVPLSGQELANPYAISVFNALRQGVSAGTLYDPKQPANPESHLALLSSNEVGKFQPGLDFLQKGIEKTNTSQRLLEQLVSLLQSNGGF